MATERTDEATGTELIWICPLRNLAGAFMRGIDGTAVTVVRKEFWHRDAFQRELNTCREISRVRCAFLLQMLADSESDEENIHLYIDYEFMENSSVREYIYEIDNQLTDLLIGKWVVQILLGLQYLNLIINSFHGNLNPDNILLDDHLDLKLSDFGSVHTNGWFGNRLGTECYQPEEMNRAGKMHHFYNTDIFSLGVIILECFWCTRSQNHFEENFLVLHEKIRNFSISAKKNQLTEGNYSLVGELKRLTLLCFAKKNYRLTASALLDSRHINSTMNEAKRTSFQLLTRIFTNVKKSIEYEKEKLIEKQVDLNKALLQCFLMQMQIQRNSQDFAELQNSSRLENINSQKQILQQNQTIQKLTKQVEQQSKESESIKSQIDSQLNSAQKERSEPPQKKKKKKKKKINMAGSFGQIRDQTTI